MPACGSEFISESGLPELVKLGLCLRVPALLFLAQRKRIAEVAQAADIFLEHVAAIRSMRQAASGVAERAGITSGIDALCLLFIADSLGGEFCSKHVLAIGGFNPGFPVKLLVEWGLIEPVDGARTDRRTRPMRLTDKGRHVIAQLEQAMAHIVARERLAA